jgi:ABC-type lipoprotein export system ATPase subunit
MVTHDSNMARYAKRIISFLDGLIALDEQNGEE